MKRDMDLIRKMVLMMEDYPSGWAPRDIEIEGYSREQIGYHSYLLVDSGLASGQSITTTASPGPEYRVRYLTSAGHDFADSARSEYIWDEVMADVKRKGVMSVTVEMAKSLLDKKLRKKLDME